MQPGHNCLGCIDGAYQKDQYTSADQMPLA